MTETKLSRFDSIPVSCNGLGECSNQPPNTIHFNKTDGRVPGLNINGQSQTLSVTNRKFQPFWQILFRLRRSLCPVQGSAKIIFHFWKRIISWNRLSFNSFPRAIEWFDKFRENCLIPRIVLRVSRENLARSRQECEWWWSAIVYIKIR
jgi:hypothetical protein